MPYLMGLDISTTGAKALIIDEAGAVIASANAPQPISQPKPLWSEQNPADWWNGISASIRGCAGRVRACAAKTSAPSDLPVKCTVWFC